MTSLRPAMSWKFNSTITATHNIIQTNTENSDVEFSASSLPFASLFTLNSVGTLNSGTTTANIDVQSNFETFYSNSLGVIAADCLISAVCTISGSSMLTCNYNGLTFLQTCSGNLYIVGFTPLEVDLSIQMVTHWFQQLPYAFLQSPPKISQVLALKQTRWEKSIVVRTPGELLNN